MPRFFVDKSDIHDNSVTISGEDAKHIIRVLRMREGDGLTLCDGVGCDYEAVIASVDKASLEAKILSVEKTASESDIEVALFQGLPKSGKMEYIIQKCTELGIKQIIPSITERCVVKLNSDADKQKKAQRYQSIALAAAKQSGRGIVPHVEPAIGIDEAIERMSTYDLCFVPYEGESTVSLKDALRGAEGVHRIAFLIGPEGGIADEELEKIKQKGIATVTLGKHILRTETAGAAVLAMINYEYLL